jgi:signal transduction histidine kinase
MFYDDTSNIPSLLEQHPRMLTVTLHDLLNRITSPVVVINADGEPLMANPTGLGCYETLAIHWELLDGPSTRQQQLARLAGSVSPVWVEHSPYYLKITPLEERPGDHPTTARQNTPTGLLEWLPMPGNARLTLLQEVSRAVNSSLILEDIFESLGEVLRRYIPYQEAAIVILDDTQNSIKTLVRLEPDGYIEISGESNAFAGYDPVVDAALRHPVPQLYEAQQWMKSVIFQSREDVADSAPPQGVTLVVPLINKGVVIGLIAMTSVLPEGFELEQQALVEQVSEQLAVAVENAKFYWQTQAQASREFLINQIIKSIRQSLDGETILTTAALELGKVTGVSRCLIHYFSADAPIRLYSYNMPGIDPVPPLAPALEQQVFQMRQGPDHLIHPFILNDTRDAPPGLAPEGYFEAHRIRSLAVFPILAQSSLVGTVTLHQCDTYRSWIAEDIQLLQAIAEHLGVALNQARLFAQLEEQKQALEQTLEELRQTQVHLIQSEKMAVLGQFVAGIAHEVNTPLGTISSNNDTLKGCVDRLQSNPERSAALVETMNELLGVNKLAADRIHEIVKNLRNFARLDESELKTVDLHEGIDSTLLVMKSSLSPHIQIEKRYDPHLPPIQCYPGLLNQVFMNLLVNATHAMADQPSGQIVIETKTFPDKLQVCFHDTGTGIAPEHLPRIFDPGFTTKRRGVGTGLGLALCFKIVEKHHGHILVDSTVGQGTTFTVELPLSFPTT